MIELKNISKNFQGFSIRDFSIRVEDGDYFMILGNSGAGKSVILEIIAGLVQPESGRIIKNGLDITKAKIGDRKVGLVFQDLAIFPHLSVFDNIAYGLRTMKLKQADLKMHVEKRAEEMNISHLLRRKADTLSGGEKQRMVLARTLAIEPDCLLLDEPLASLDVQLKKEIRSLLKKINKRGVSIIHVSHDYEEALSLSNKIAVLDQGRIVQQGPTYEVLQNPKSGFIANFTGVKNFYPVQLTKESERSEVKAVVDDRISFCISTNKTSGEGYVIIPCDHILLSKERLDSSACNNFKGKVKDIVPDRRGVEVLLDIGIPITALLMHESLEKIGVAEGKEFWVSFKASALKFIRH